MLTQAGNPTDMSHGVSGAVPAPPDGTACRPLAGNPIAAIAAAPPLRRRSSRPALGRDDADAPRGGPPAGTATAATAAASPLRGAASRLAMAGATAGHARMPRDGRACRPLARTDTAVIPASSPFGRALDRQAMAGDGIAPPRGGPPAGNAAAELTVASPSWRATADTATARPSPTLGRWHRHGEPGDRCRPPAAIARDDPRYSRLPYGDGAVHRFACEAPTAESVTLAIGLLRSAGWRVHRAGAAMAAHHPSGRRWIVGWTVGDRRPAWLDRLPVLAARSAA